MIYHLMLAGEWESRHGMVTVAIPGQDEFLHCCDERQVTPVRVAYFPPDSKVVALGLDPTLLGAETRYEPGSHGELERFPHVYGPIQASEIVSVLDL
jgi:uncharacterized protein (DUF952 family)